MMHIGKGPDGAKIRLPPTDFLTHGVVLGRTGSGKSGLTIALLEEVAKSGASALVLDPKGDLTNLALSLSTEPEFEPWSEFPDEDRLKHGEGLARSDLSFRDVEEWRDHVDVTIFAPGKISGGGKHVNLFPDPRFPGSMTKVSRTRASQLVSAVLGAVGEGGDPYDPAVVFLAEAVLSQWANGKGLPVEEWPGVLTNPNESLQEFGGMPLADFYPKRQRTKLARKLIGFHHQADRWLRGENLDLKAFTQSAKPQIAVFTMRHLSEEDRQFFAGLLLNKVVDFMFETEASEQLKLLVVLDEARGYLPPHPYNPPTKDPICTILAQGRAQGIGMIVGTQNPMDLDYKALSNVGTWFLGRLRERDCARDLLSELSSRGITPEDVANVPQRNFLLLDKRGGHQRFETRWCLNYLFGPMSGEQVERIQPTDRIVWPAKLPKPAPAPLLEEVRQPLVTVSAPAPKVKVYRPLAPRPPKAVVIHERERKEAPIIGEIASVPEVKPFGCLRSLFWGIVYTGIVLGWIAFCFLALLCWISFAT